MENVTAVLYHAELSLISRCLLIEVIVIQADRTGGLLERVLLVVKHDQVLQANDSALQLQLLEELVRDSLTDSS